jgi:CrcB protein
VSSFTHRITGIEGFPVGTLAVNVLGCLAIGFIAGLAEVRQYLDPDLRLVLVVGLLGGFTTYSAFAYDTLVLAQESQMLKAGLNTLLQVVLGFVAAAAGYAWARSL